VTSIEWTDETWNPTRGCSRVSAGCEHCYAERQAIRHAGPGRPYEGLVRMVNGHPVWTGRVVTVPEKLEEPLRWRKPRRVFVDSMSDLFHDDLPVDFLADVFAVMAIATRHTFQVLTKRPTNMLALLSSGNFWIAVNAALWRRCEPVLPGGAPLILPNVWLGVSVEDQASADERIPLLLETPAAIRFVSYEPALGPVSLCAAIKVDWIIVGGESGPGARPIELAWVRDTIAWGRCSGVPVFVKQLGARPLEPARPIDVANPTAGRLQRMRIRLRDRKGGDPSEWPEDLRVREWP